MDSKVLKSLFGEKVSLVNGEEMKKVTGMQPGCMTPFGLEDKLIKSIVMDTKIDEEDLLILAFGSETMSMEISPQDLHKILEYSYLFYQGRDSLGLQIYIKNVNFLYIFVNLKSLFLDKIDFIDYTNDSRRKCKYEKNIAIFIDIVILFFYSCRCRRYSYIYKK